MKNITIKLCASLILCSTQVIGSALEDDKRMKDPQTDRQTYLFNIFGPYDLPLLSPIPSTTTINHEELYDYEDYLELRTSMTGSDEKESENK